MEATVYSPTLSYSGTKEGKKYPLTQTMDGALRVHIVNQAGDEPIAGLTDAELRAAPVPVQLAAVAVSNFPATQAVSGTFWQVTQPVSIASMPSTPVTGTFFQATQPVSLASNTPDVTDRAERLLGHVTLDNASVAVTGSFWQSTQPVSAAALPLPSGASTEATLAAIKAKTDNIDVALSTRTKPADTQAVSLASVPTHAVTQSGAWSVGVTGTVPVSGTFWQATQPVSGPVTDAQLRAAPVAVSGSFWQATQPVSIASMPSTPVTGTFFQATQPVSIAAQVKAREDTAAMTWTSLKSAAPAANAVQADTGALAAGDYDFNINLTAADTLAVGKGMVIEHRNAANAATLFNLGGVVAGGSNVIDLRRYTLLLNERIRVIAGTAAGTASSMYVSAIGRRVS